MELDHPSIDRYSLHRMLRQANISLKFHLRYLGKYHISDQQKELLTPRTRRRVAASGSMRKPSTALYFTLPTMATIVASAMGERDRTSRYRYVCRLSQADITVYLAKQATTPMYQSRGQLNIPPTQRQACAPESKKLLSVCLKRLKGLAQTRLVDAYFVWTEPHS